MSCTFFSEKGGILCSARIHSRPRRASRTPRFPKKRIQDDRARSLNDTHIIGKLSSMYTHHAFLEHGSIQATDISVVIDASSYMRFALAASGAHCNVIGGESNRIVVRRGMGSLRVIPIERKPIKRRESMPMRRSTSIKLQTSVLLNA